MPRRPLPRLVALCAAAVLAVSTFGVSPAVAAPTFTPSPYGSISGDVTGDGVADRVQLGYAGRIGDQRCVTRVSAGLGHGRFAPPVTVVLPTRGEVSECPDLGAVLTAPDPAANRLAVGFFCCAPRGDDLVQVFSLVGSTPTYVTGFSTGLEALPSRIGSVDFDGDGWGDLWENTDEGDGFVAMLTRGDHVRSLVSVPSGWFVGVQFADLDHRGGTDILLGTSSGYGGPEAVVVDGRTGATQTLASGYETPTGESIDDYQLSIVDLDHDTYPDVRVDAVSQSGGPHVLGTSYWRNRSQGNRWRFVPASPPVA